MKASGCPLECRFAIPVGDSIRLVQNSGNSHHKINIDMANHHEKELPKISIITPVYNNAPYIEDCVKSVLNQDYPHLEYIIIDGGSTDGTVDIIEKYANRLSYFESKKDRGQTHALNKGFAHATGDIFAWLNADEQYLSGTLCEVGRAFASHSGLDFFYGNRIVVDKNLVEIGERGMLAVSGQGPRECMHAPCPGGPAEDPSGGLVIGAAGGVGGSCAVETGAG